MTVVLSILLAVVVGGVCFMLIERWQRPTEASTAQKPQREIWTPDTPMATTASLFVPRSSQPAPFREQYPLPPGRSAESTLPLPGNQVPPEKDRTEPLPPRPGRTLWDDPARDDDDDRRPPGLWSGWADR